MAVFYNNSITDAGRLLWADMQAGGSLKATKIAVGSGYMPAGATVKTMTALSATVKELEINKVEKLPEGDFVFGGMFSNADLEAPFYYRELGLFAKVINTDGTETDEVLYAYGNNADNAELIPAYSTATAIERQLDIITYIGNDASVVVEIASGVLVTKPEFDEAVEALRAADQALKDSLNTVQLTADERINAVEKQLAEVVQPLSEDVAAIYERLDEDEERIADLEARADGHDEDVKALQADDARIETLAVSNAARMDALWDALLSDITENPATVSFEDLEGITLTGGVWNTSMQRLEV